MSVAYDVNLHRIILHLVFVAMYTYIVLFCILVPVRWILSTAVCKRNAYAMTKMLT